MNNNVIEWILTLTIVISVWYIYSGRKWLVTSGGKLAYKTECKKIFFKYILPIIISLPISLFIYLIISHIFNDTFVVRPINPYNINSIITSQLDNGLAIILGLACFMERYIAVLIKSEDIRNIKIWYVIQGGLGGYLLIISLTIMPYINIYLDGKLHNILNFLR